MQDSLSTKAQAIRLVVLDVDGVLTDGSLWVGPQGEAIKRFHTRDGLGIKMLQAAGIPVAILTGRVSAQTAARAKELGIESVAQGKLFKTDAWHEILHTHHVTAQECAYMGDDVPDLPVLRATGLSSAPADAAPCVLDIVDWVSPEKGGNGAVRSLAELILKAQGKWDALVESRYIRGEIHS